MFYNFKFNWCQIFLYNCLYVLCGPWWRALMEGCGLPPGLMFHLRNQFNLSFWHLAYFWGEGVGGCLWLLKEFGKRQGMVFIILPHLQMHCYPLLFVIYILSSLSNISVPGQYWSGNTWGEKSNLPLRQTKMLFKRLA